MDLKRYRHELEFLGLVIVIFLTWHIGRYLRIDVWALQKSLAKFPVFYSGLLYSLLYVVVSFFILFSKDIFWLTGAVLFGPALSTLFICFAETVNAAILFFIARRLGRGYIEKSVPEKYRHLDEKLGRISLAWLFVFRTAPLIPYRFMDLASGLTRIHFKKYLTAVIFGTPLKMLWIQYILYGVGINLLHNPQAIVEYFLNNRSLLMFSLVYVFLVVAVIFKIAARD